MCKRGSAGTLEMARTGFREIAEKERMLGVEISVTARALSADEAIGAPGRRDFPIIVGRERVIEAIVRGAKGHAFTDSPREFLGTLKDVINLELETNQNRAIFMATLNAVLGHLEMAEATVHCRDDDPEKCARETAGCILREHGRVNVGLIGLNPAIAERLAETFGADHVRISDLDRDNIGGHRYGVEVWDGNERTPELVRASDVVLLTGTTLVNGTFDYICNEIRGLGRKYLVYGVTAAGVSKLIGFRRICPYGRKS